MKRIIIDFAGSRYIGELHSRIREAFLQSNIGFPDFYGNNLDALWDCLTGFIETPVEITLIGGNQVAEIVKDAAVEVIKVFEEASKGDWEIHCNIK